MYFGNHGPLVDPIKLKKHIINSMNDKKIQTFINTAGQKPQQIGTPMSLISAAKMLTECGTNKMPSRNACWSHTFITLESSINVTRTDLPQTDSCLHITAFFNQDMKFDCLRSQDAEIANKLDVTQKMHTCITNMSHGMCANPECKKIAKYLFPYQYQNNKQR